MTYVILDLEWSQPLRKEDKLFCRDGRPFSAEVIQIGAVAVCDGVLLPDRFCTVIKPEYYRVVTKKILKMTGITKEMLKNGEHFFDAMDAFQDWIFELGAEKIVTWGYDDMPVLYTQCRYFGYDCGWLPDWFNLQPVFTHQYGLNTIQMALAAAVETAGIEQELRFHDALNDAVYTALLLNRIDDLENAVEAEKRREYIRKNPFTSLCVYDSGVCRNQPDRILLHRLRKYVCPMCGRTDSIIKNAVEINEDEYFAFIDCEKHGFAVTLKFFDNNDGTCRFEKEYKLVGGEEKQRCLDIISEGKNAHRTVADIIKAKKQQATRPANKFTALTLYTRGGCRITGREDPMRLHRLRRYICPVCGRPDTLAKYSEKKSKDEYKAIMNCGSHAFAVTVRIRRDGDMMYWEKETTLTPPPKRQKKKSAVRR